MNRIDFVKDLDKNVTMIKTALHNAEDLIIRYFELQLSETQTPQGVLIYLDKLADPMAIHSQILHPLLGNRQIFDHKVYHDPLSYLITSVITASNIEEVENFEQAIFKIMSGRIILIVDGIACSISIELMGWKGRNITPPQTESIVRGPRDSFVEAIDQDIMLIRRRLRDPNLRFKTAKVGHRTKTDVAIVYIEGFTNPELVKNVEERLAAVDIDGILDSGYIEQMIEDCWWSPFPTIQDTERPDEVVGSLLEGRVAIIVDNTPFALLMPANLVTQMGSPEDYYLRWIPANFTRFIRFIAMILAIATPAVYVSLVSYHAEMLPVNLALSIAATRQAIPFPAFFEVFVMEFSLEFLREAGIRLPAPIGQTIGIVGGLVIGEAAVGAKLVSPAMVIVVALTAIASFIMPTYTFGLGVRITRFFLMAAGAILGLYGVSLGIAIVLAHMCSLKSFGVSYLSPIAPTNTRDWLDAGYRAPWYKLNRRPRFMGVKDLERQPRKSRVAKRRIR